MLQDQKAVVLLLDADELKRREVCSVQVELIVQDFERYPQMQ
jgi:hypothetical protein